MRISIFTSKVSLAFANKSENGPDQQQQFKLDCQPGEQRQFSYESSTKVWGSSSQQVRLRASLRLKCMEPPTNTTLKYLAEIVSLVPSFEHETSDAAPAPSSSSSSSSKSKSKLRVSSKLLRTNDNGSSWSQTDASKWAPSASSDQLVGDSWEPRAEPLFEEVGEVASRVKRSVSGWFAKTWTNVKDFFVNIFSSSEKSSVSREQAFKESGLDIAAQCKSSKGKGKTPGGLPFDESVFDDLGPEYYLGASVDAHGTGYEFSLGPGGHLVGSSSSSGVPDAYDAGAKLSFFDDPEPGFGARPPATRPKRAATGEQQQQRARSPKLLAGQYEDFDKLLRLPFMFIQSRAGKIIEIRFGADEADLSVKNFKRHLCDLFATNLEANKQATNEVSPIGKHQTNYLLDSAANSIDEMKRSLIKSSNNVGDQQSTKQLVRALAMVGQQAGADSADTGARATLDQGRDPNGNGNQDDPQQQVSVLRSITTTSEVQLSSKTLASDIDQIQVQVRQVQQISDGRLTGTAGQLSMSLLQQQSTGGAGQVHRTKREAPDGHEHQQVADIVDLVQVSTAFSLQLVPLSTSGGDADPQPARARAKRSAGQTGQAGQAPHRNDDTASASRKHEVLVANSSATTKTLGRPAARPSVTRPPPVEPHELQRVLQDWRKLEAHLQLSPASLVAENNGQQEGRWQRLEVLRDQVRLRLNEEFVRNRVRRSLEARRANRRNEPNESARGAANGGDLGLGLTQLVLGTGVTSKQKGSIYQTLEEVVELETSLADEASESAVSRLMRDTIRMETLRGHCKSSVATIDELREAHAAARLVELRPPFGVGVQGADSSWPAPSEPQPKRSERILNQFRESNSRKLDQCKRILQLLLKLNERRAADLVLDLIDDCNQRLLAAAKNEELGYGPTGKYYRHLRQQFVELLAHYNRPSETLVDKLMARLHYPKFTSSPNIQQQDRDKRRPKSEQPEFVYVPTGRPESATRIGQQKYNKSILKEEDDYNNNDGAGSLVMTITALAAKSSIGRAKKVEVADKLLHSLKGTTCSLFDAPDLDIIESMANFQEQLDEIVGKVIHLARKCKHFDQYVVACVHGLSGQLQHASTLRFLVEQLRSPNASCTLKSEIVLTLIGAQLVADLRQTSDNSQLGGPNNTLLLWPNHGLNQVDETLIELVSGADGDKRHNLDKRCLDQLVAHYLSRKRHLSLRDQQLVGRLGKRARGSRSHPGHQTLATRSRLARAIVNEQNFWDEAQCKRWTVSSTDASGDIGALQLANNPGAAGGGQNSSLLNYPNDLVDEIDDNSILNALLNQQRQQQQQQQQQTNRRSSRRNQKLLERELDPTSLPNNITTIVTALRRRHKCAATKSIGPKNAQATLNAEIVNDLVGPKDENKFLARFRLAANFLGNRIDVGRIYLWHQRRTTRAHANILGRSIWDTSHNCQDRAPHQMLYMPLFDLNLWLVKVSVGLRLSAEMGFFSNCDTPAGNRDVAGLLSVPLASDIQASQPDELELYPTISLRAAGEASAKFVMARAGMSLASQYSYQGNIRVSKQPESCMSIYSAHQPMNVTFSSWFQLWDSDCHFWGSRNRAEPLATKWRLAARKPTAWLEDECLISTPIIRRNANNDIGNSTTSSATPDAEHQNKSTSAPVSTRSPPQIISP